MSDLPDITLARMAAALAVATVTVVLGEGLAKSPPSQWARLLSLVVIAVIGALATGFCLVGTVTFG